MALTDPLPSPAADVLQFSAEKIDEFAASNALSYTDRFGNVRLTAAGLEQLVRDITSPATDFWLEPSISDPLTGHGGVPLEAGMVYLNVAATPPKLRRYDGTVWNDLNPTNTILW